MNKITLFALAAAFPTNHQVLTMLCLATPQPETAVEHLLGIFTEPEIPQCIKQKYNTDKVCKFVSADWMATEQITYSYSETNQHYFKTEAEAAQYTQDGSNSNKGTWRKGEEEYLFVGVFTKVKSSTMSLKNWLEGTPVQPATVYDLGWYFSVIHDTDARNNAIQQFDNGWKLADETDIDFVKYTTTFDYATSKYWYRLE